MNTIFVVTTNDIITLILVAACGVVAVGCVAAEPIEAWWKAKRNKPR